MSDYVKLIKQDLLCKGTLGNIRKRLMREILWERHDPDRKEAFFNRSGYEYQYSDRKGFRPQSHPEIPQVLRMLWDYVETVSGYDYDVCFVNWYENEKATIGWHKDDSPSLDPAFPVTVMALGAPRATSYRPDTDQTKVEHFIAGDGDVLVMLPGTNQRYQHAVLESKEPCEERLSLVFRKIRWTKQMEQDFDLYGVLTPEQRALLKGGDGDAY